MGLQKRVHLELSALPRDQPLPKYWLDRRWILGFVCMTVASFSVLVNYSILDQSRASAFSSLTIVSNAIMAKYYLREEFTRYDAAAAVCIVTGVVICAIFGAVAPAGSPQTLQELWVELSRTTVYVVSPLIFLLVVLLFSFVRYSESLLKKSYSLSRMECFARAFLAGIFSGSTGFFAKAVVCAITDTVQHEYWGGSLGDPRFYVFILGLPASIFLQIKCLNDGLRAFDTVELVPIYQACIVGVGVSWGWLFYEENKNLTRQGEYYFALGVLISVGGIGILSCKRRGGHDGEGRGGGSGSRFSSTAVGGEKEDVLQRLLVASPGGSSLVSTSSGSLEARIGIGERQGLLPRGVEREESHLNPFSSSSGSSTTSSSNGGVAGGGGGLVPVTGALFKGQSFYTPHLL